jgi:hypothetical protein
LLSVESVHKGQGAMGMGERMPCRTMESCIGSKCRGSRIAALVRDTLGDRAAF